jgi:hypothetical protein
MAAIPLVTGGLAIYGRSSGWLAAYVVSAVGFLGLIYRFFCTHCPHYTREGRTTQCMFFWGMPKFFSPRPGPLSGLEKTVTLAASAAILLFPVPWLLAKPGLLIIYILSLGIFAASMVRQECRRCLHFDCPANRVPHAMRKTADSGDI